MPCPARSTPTRTRSEPLLVRLGRSRSDLVDRLGVPADVADQAMAAPDEDAVLDARRNATKAGSGLLLVDLATSDSIDAIVERLHLEAPDPTGDDDADLLRSLQQPAAQAQFAFIDDQEELRRVIENGDFGAWRVFLHPEQRHYVERRYNGAVPALRRCRHRQDGRARPPGPRAGPASGPTRGSC